MIKVGLIGGRGYVGEEFLRLVQHHGAFQPVFVGSSSYAGKQVSDVFPDLNIDLSFSPVEEAVVASCDAEAWVIAQPNGQAGRFVKLLDKRPVRIVDVSSDFRFDDHWVYGLSECNADTIQNSTRVSNPGCYATAAQLGLLPIVSEIQSEPVIYGISGYSGAGRAPTDKNDPIRLRSNIVPYSLTGHTHEREISQQIGRDVCFLPHVAEFFRGISATIAVELDREVDVDFLIETFQRYYRDQPLVKVDHEIPEIRQVVNTNACHIGGFSIDTRDSHRIVLVSVLDNLRKGAASQVLQNLNLMFGLNQEQGLM